MAPVAQVHVMGLDTNMQMKVDSAMCLFMFNFIHAGIAPFYCYIQPEYPVKLD